MYLRHVDLNSAGTYRCEVSAEAPEFQTVAAEKQMSVFGKFYIYTSGQEILCINVQIFHYY